METSIWNRAISQIVMKGASKHMVEASREARNKETTFVPDYHNHMMYDTFRS